VYRKIDTVTLRSGEKAELGVVTGPDEIWGRKIQHLLSHKGEIWKWQIEQNLFNPDCGSESYFYVLSNENGPFANILIAERLGIGIFGHVWTIPEMRKKGAADIINRYLMDDFKKRNGRALYLGTTYDSPAYHLYARNGFLGCASKSGGMYYFSKNQKEFESEIFAPASISIEPFSFKHWPLLPALAMSHHSASLRIMGMGLDRPGTIEGTSLEFLQPPVELELSFRVQLAISQKSQVPVAIACRRPEKSFGSQVDLLDIFSAPHHEEQLPKLIEALEISKNRKTICYVDDSWPSKKEWLKKAGWEREVVLKNHFRNHLDQVKDIEIWSRFEEMA
jgi:hypothetical protein